MQTHLGRLSIAMVTVLYSLFHIAGASQHFGASPLLSPRDQTCSDGGVCLSGPGLVCCPSSEPGTGGCMWSGSVCCGGGKYCGPNQFCSSPNNGEVNCCLDSACNTVVYSGGIDVIAYTDQSLYPSETAAATTSAGSPQTTRESTPTTKKSGSTTNGSPTATATSAAELTVQVDLMAGLLVPFFAMVWTLLGTQT